jgi:hypothetical protein
MAEYPALEALRRVVDCDSADADTKYRHLRVVTNKFDVRQQETGERYASGYIQSQIVTNRFWSDYTKEADALIPEAQALAKVSSAFEISVCPFSFLTALYIGRKAHGGRRQTSHT